MSDQQADLQECPFCRESVPADASVCRYCRSGIPPASHGHGGVCPYCRESIHPEAVKCRYCLSDVGVGTAGCGCAGRAVVDRTSRPGTPSLVRFPRGVTARRGRGTGGVSRVGLARSSECPEEIDLGADGTLQLVLEDAEHCYYILDPRSYM